MCEESSAQEPDVVLHGYSERGMVNAVFYDIMCSEESLSMLKELLEWCEFPFDAPSFEDVATATVIVEQSFADFGEPDLLILLKDKDGQPKHAVFLEAKVKTATVNFWRIRDEWAEFERHVTARNRKTSSNLFVQLYRKVRLIAHLSDRSSPLPADAVSDNWSLGSNKVIEKAVERLSQYRENVWYVAIVPDSPPSTKEFFENTLQGFEPREDDLRAWDTSHWGYLCWKSVEDRCKESNSKWLNVKGNFSYNINENKSQIYSSKPDPAEQPHVGIFYGHSSGPVLVDTVGTYTARVVPLAEESDYFPKSFTVANASLTTQLDPQPDFEVNRLQPEHREIYTWAPPEEQNPCPSRQNEEAQPPFGSQIRIVRAGAETSRVILVDGDDEEQGQNFLVYTHHLRRP